MNKKKRTVEELLQDLIILELAKAGVPQAEIQKVVGVDILRVNKIAKCFKDKR
jgi:hypothetical protein